MPILAPLPRPQRRRIHKITYATRDKGHARLLMAILLLHEGRTVTDVHHHYRRTKTITLILDNYIIHKSKQTE